ncbi:hypothetical protein Tco_1308148, partial [Tanacetum coccineum]
SVMLDSEHSTITYTSISSDDGSLDVGSLGVIVIGYDGLPMMPEDPYAYVEAAMQEPPPPNFVPEPLLPTAVSPTSDSPSYITESDPEYDPKEDDEDPEEDPANYPTNKDDDKDEEEEESSRDDADNKEEDEGKDEEEEEHLAPADSVPPLAYRTTARMSIQAQTPIPFSLRQRLTDFLPY